MAVNEDVSAYSNAAASNTPAGGDTVGPDLDNHLRDMKKNIRQVAENFITVTDENFKGRIKTDTAGSTHTLKYFADSGDMSLFQVDDSASSVTVFIDDVVMGAAAKNFNKQTTTASAQTALDLTIRTVGGQLLAETETASARSRLDLGTAALENVGTTAGDVPEFISGSATSIAALPVSSGENLTNLNASLFVAGTALTMDPYVVATQQTQAHGLSGEPEFLDAVLECNSAQASWVAGDRIQLGGKEGDAAGGTGPGYTIFKDATSVGIITNVSGREIFINNKTTGVSASLSGANWKIIVTPYKIT